MEITKEQYDEYEKLKRWAKRQEVYQSAKSVLDLFDDIDIPIRASVGMLALLGCEPQYSCCGFDYVGQPFHKSHQYGRPYVILKKNPTTEEFVGLFLKENKTWSAKRGALANLINLEVIVDGNPFWRKKECIHFSEECVICIEQLEKFLWQTRMSMADSAILCDTNVFAKEINKHWQYPPKRIWTVVKADIYKTLSFS